MKKSTLLLIDDDQTLTELLADHARPIGYEVITANNGQDGLRLASEATPDMIVLDIMMPGMDGWDVCRRLRKTSYVPVIMLTAKNEEFDKLRGFHLGIDDYVTKPFSFAELMARISAILARTRRDTIPANQITSDDLIIDLDQKHVLVSGQDVDLTPTEYRLLETMARHANRTVPTETLLFEVWGPQYAGEVKHVKHYIWTLRKKIEADPGDPKHILTERGFGYRFV